MADNTGSNLGTGHIVFSSKVGDDLQFKTLTAGTNITLANTATEISITASNDTTALNLGTGSGLFTSKDADNLQFKSLIANAASGISLTSNANDLTLQLVTANVDAGKLGGVAASNFLQKSNNLSGLTNTATARTNLEVYSKTEIDSFALKNNANVLPQADNTYSLGNNSNRWSAIYANRFYGVATSATAVNNLAGRSITELQDVSDASPTNGQIMKYNSGTSLFEFVSESTYSNSDWDTQLATKDSDDVSEGTTNLYYTDARSRAALSGGTGVTYNSGTGQISIGQDVTSGATVTFGTVNAGSLILSGDLTVNGTTTTVNSTTTTLDDPVITLGGDTAPSSDDNKDRGVEFRWHDGTNPKVGFFGRDDGTGNFVYIPEATNTSEVFTGSIGPFDLSATSINSLSDVDTVTSGPISGQVLKWNGSNWVPADDATSGGGGLNADTLDGQDSTYFLNYNNLSNKPTIPSALADLSNVNNAAPTNGQVLTWDNANSYWKPADASGGGSGNFVGLTDTPANFSGAAGRFVKVNSSANALEFVAVDTDGIIEGSSNLYYTSARANADFDTRLATKSTTNLAEGTNLYYTDARVNARVSALGSANWNTAYGWGDHSTAGYQTTAGLNAAIDTHLNQSNPTSGYVLSWNGSDYAWVTNAGYTNTDFDNRLASKDTGDLTEGSNLYFTNARADARISAASINALSDVNTAGITSGQVLSWNGSAFVASNAGAGDITRVNITAGTGLTGTQDTASGEHTQTLAVDVGTTANKIIQLDGSARLPAVDGSQLTNLPAKTFASLTGKPTTIAGYGITDAFDGAFGSLTGKPTTIAGYGITNLNASIDAHLNQSNPTSGYVLSWNGSDYAWVAQSGGGGGGSMNDLVDDTTPQLGGTLDANGNTIDMGTNVITDTKVGQWDTAYGWGNHASAGYLSSETFTSLVQDTTPQLGGNLDVQSSKIKSSGDNVQLGEGISATGFTGTLASRLYGLAAYFTRTSDNSKRHYSTGWNNTQTLSTNVDAANKKQGWHTDSTLNLGGYTHGTNDVNDVSKLFGDYSYTNLTSSGNTTANGLVGHVFQAEVRDDSVGTINTSHIIGVKARAGNYKAGSTATNAYGLYVDTAKDGAATITNRYSIYAPESSDKAYFAGPVQVGNWTLPTADGTNGQVLKTDGAGNVTWQTGSGHSTTDTLTEGSTNLYFTNARATSAITGSSLNMGSNDITTTGKIYYANMFATEGALPNATTYHGMFAHVHGTGAGYFAHGGNWVKLANNSQLANSSNWDTAYGWGNHASAGYLTSYTPGANSIDDTMIDFGTGANQVSTADVPEQTNLYYTNARADARIVAAGSANWNTAYGWGDHGAAGYQTSAGLNAAIDSHLNQSNPTAGYVLSWNGSDYAWVVQSGGGGSVAGSDTQVQFNDGGSFGGDAGFTYNKNTDTATVGKIVTTNTGSPSVSSSGVLAISTTASNSNITITPHGSGKIQLDGIYWPTADGSAGQKLTTDGAGNLSWTADGDDLSNNDTDDLAEGSTNKYYTDARVDARFDIRLATKSTTNLTEGTNLYFTNARADARITNNLLDEDNFASNSATNTASQQSIKAYVDAKVATKDNTDEITEGSTNLYFTNARATSAITGSNLNMGSNNITTTGKILFANVYSAEGDLPSASTYHGMFAHVHGTGAAYYAHAGNWVKLANNSQLANSSNWDTAYGWGNHASAGYSSLTDLSVGSEGSASGNGSIAYNNGTGVFTYTPPVLSGLTGDTDDISEGSSNLYFTNARADARIGAADIADLNNVNNAAPTDGQVLTWDNSNSYWKPADASGGGTTVVERFKINYATNGNLSSISDKTSGISSVSIDSAAGGDITINTTGYSYPPANIIYYGYQYASNKYNVTNMNKDVTLREVPGGGSSGSPTAFGSFSSVKVKASENDTGAGRSFGTVTHAWVQLVMGG